MSSLKKLLSQVPLSYFIFLAMPDSIFLSQKFIEKRTRDRMLNTQGRASCRKASRLPAGLESGF